MSNETGDIPAPIVLLSPQKKMKEWMHSRKTNVHRTVFVAPIQGEKDRPKQ